MFLSIGIKKHGCVRCIHKLTLFVKWMDKRLDKFANTWIIRWIDWEWVIAGQTDVYMNGYMDKSMNEKIDG